MDKIVEYEFYTNIGKKVAVIDKRKLKDMLEVDEIFFYKEVEHDVY